MQVFYLTFSIMSNSLASKSNIYSYLYSVHTERSLAVQKI